PVDAVVLDAERAGDDPADLDVEAARGVRSGLEEADAGLVVLHADGDLAGLGELGHLRPGLELRVLGHLDVRAAPGAAAGGQRQGEPRGCEGCLRASESHDFSLWFRAWFPPARIWWSVLEDLAEEVLGAVRLRVGEELLGRVLLDDLTVSHEQHPVGGGAG